MKNLIILLLLALGLASCTYDDYQEVDSGIVVCVCPINNRVGLEHFDSTTCCYNLKHLYDEMTINKLGNKKIEPSDTIYIFKKGQSFVAGKTKDNFTQKVCVFLDGYIFHPFCSWKNLLILLGILLSWIAVKKLTSLKIKDGCSINKKKLAHIRFWLFFLICGMIACLIYGCTIDFNEKGRIIPECGKQIIDIERNTV